MADENPGQSKSTVELRTNYEPGEQASANDINRANALLKKLVSNSDILRFKHLADGSGIECTVETAELRAFIKDETKDVDNPNADYQGDIQEWDGDGWTNSGLNPSDGDLLYYDGSTWQLLSPPSSGNYALVSEGGTLGWRELGCETTT